MTVNAGGILYIISSGTVTLNAVSEAGTIIINSTGNPAISTGGSSPLYYAGSTLYYYNCAAIPENAKAWPTASGPTNVIINSPYGVTISSNRSIAGTLYLTNGALNVSGATLTFNGTAAPISLTSGTITCTSSSSFNFSPSAAANWTIPAGTFASPTLNNFIVDMKSGGSLSLNDNITVSGTLILTSGILNITGNTLTFNGSGSVAPISRNTGTITCTSSPSFSFNPYSAGDWLIPPGSFTSAPTLTNFTIAMQSGNYFYLNNQDVICNGTFTLTSGIALLEQEISRLLLLTFLRQVQQI